MPLVNSAENTASAFPGFLEGLQLSFDPFEPEDDDFVFYRGAQRGLILEQLVRLSEGGAGVIAVAGDPGSGRSTLKQQLGDLCYGSRRLCEITVDEVTTPQEIFGALAVALECEVTPGASTGEMMALIRQRLNQLGSADFSQPAGDPDSAVESWDELDEQGGPPPREQGGRDTVLLLLDDAHLLGDAVLSALLSLLQASGSAGELPLHMVLFGDFELVQRLDAIALVDVLLQDLALPLLDIDELADYLEVKLGAAGWDGALPFDAAELEQLFIVSGGVPGQVHDAAREMLALKSDCGAAVSPTPGPVLPVAHMFSLVVLIGVLLMAFFYKDNWLSGSDSGAGAAAGDPKTSVVTTSDPVAVAAPGVKPERRQESLEVVLKPLATGKEKPLAVGNEKPLAVDNGPSQGREEAGGESDSATGLSAGTVSTSAPAAQAEAVKTASQRLPEALRRPGEAVGDAPLTAPGVPSPLSPDEKFLLSLSSGQYVLQVMAAGSEAAVEAFIQRQVNRQELRLFATLRSGQPWFVVVTGVYPSAEAARIGVASLPSEQKKVGPWPRSVADVHLKIREFHRI